MNESQARSSQIETFSYDNRIVRLFVIATIVWGVAGMLVGLIAAIQLYVPGLNLGLAVTTFSHIRPLHTNAVIFAFVGNAIFFGVYYSLQRLCKARLYSDFLSAFHFWSWQAVIVGALITIPLGYTTSKEYAELEWPFDILIALSWIAFGINMIGTIIKRREQHMYVAIWFYLATWIAVTVLHVVNSLAIPVSLMKSYSVFAGVQDALVQWWYGHNAVAFFLTTPYLGLMYYYLPKAAERPVYSYKLSILHFWALIFIYIWAGPHHLLYTSLPDWAQSLGTAFSIMLIAPSWGGMLNGLLTLRGAWDKVREEPILKFLVVAVTAYGMATFEGPTLAVKSVNALSHFTDWTVAHVHVGTLGWNGFLTFGILYWIVPRLWRTPIFSKKMANAHFWIGFLGIIFWVVPIYWAGIAQGLMWKQFTPDGMLQYPNFLETVLAIIPMYVIRSVGGAMYLFGFVLMIVNLFLTIRKGSFIAQEEAKAAPLIKDVAHASPFRQHVHRWLESKPFPFIILTTVAILIGGIIEIVPTVVVKSNVPTIASVKPYTPLELEGRDIYISEGCNACHSQMIRPFRSETERYGEYSKAGEFVYDHPFLWGSKRTGPDLQREGGKYPNAWHYFHMIEPGSMSPGSIMPVYPWLAEKSYDSTGIVSKMKSMKSIGTPYTDEDIAQAIRNMNRQAEGIAEDLKQSGVQIPHDRQLIALIAYLQRLGVDIKGTPAKQLPMK